MEKETMNELNALLKASNQLPDTNEGEYAKLPDGSYNATVYSVKFTESKSNNLMFVWEFILTDGDVAKRHEWKYQLLNSPENMKRLITDLRKFGIDTEGGIEQIQSQFDSILDVPVTLEIKSTPNKNAPEKEPFRNISIKL